MTLKDVRDYVTSLGIADQVYMGMLPNKPDRAIGVYNDRQQHPYRVPIGGLELESYGTKYVTLLVHWNQSPGETEEAAQKLFKALCETWDTAVNNKKIKWIQPLYEPQDVGPDAADIFEMVIEVAVIFEKRG